MRVEVRFANTEGSPELVQYIERHVTFALSRFSSRLKRTSVRLDDLNGPRGGIDKVCKVEVVGDFGHRIVEARGLDVQAVTVRALEMAERSVTRALTRQRAYDHVNLNDAVKKRVS